MALSPSGKPRTGSKLRRLPPTLRSVIIIIVKEDDRRCLGIDVPGSAGAQGAAHVGVYEGKTVDVTGIYPAESGRC